MDDFIFSYYSFLPDSITHRDQYYIIKKDNSIYYLSEVIDDSKIRMQYHLSLKYPFYDSFILNCYSSIYSFYQNSRYVLFKKKKGFSFLQSSFLLFFSSYSLLWYYHWISRSDFLEDTYQKIKGIYSLIDDSFDYYLGLLEMAIFHLQDYKDAVGNGYIQHQKCNSFFNNSPLNIVIDFKERDFSEYLKFIFWNDLYQDIDISSLIYENRNQYNYSLVLARFLYPNYYFDIFDEVVFFHKNQNSLKKYLTRILEFQKYYETIVVEIEKYYPIKKISF